MTDETLLAKAAKFLDHRLTGPEAVIAISLMADFHLAQENRLLKFLTDIRFALGDNGKRMQDELVEYCKEIREKAEAEKELKLLVDFINSSEDVPLGFYEEFLEFKQEQAEG